MTDCGKAIELAKLLIEKGADMDHKSLKLAKYNLRKDNTFCRFLKKEAEKMRMKKLDSQKLEEKDDFKTQFAKANEMIAQLKEENLHLKVDYDSLKEENKGLLADIERLKVKEQQLDRIKVVYENWIQNF